MREGSVKSLAAQDTKGDTSWPNIPIFSLICIIVNLLLLFWLYTLLVAALELLFSSCSGRSKVHGLSCL